MNPTFDLTIRRARLRRKPFQTLYSIGIRGGRIAAITEETLRGECDLDAEGRLVSASFVDAHLHLCKVYTLPLAGEEALRQYTAGTMGASAAGIERAAAVKDRYDEAWIYPNARRALLAGLKHGVTHVQAFADTDGRARLEGVKALLRLREEFRGIVDLRVVAFPQEGVLRDPPAEAYVREALERGADVVGGIPWLEDTDREAREHIARMLKLAREFDRDVAMLVDDAGDANLRTAEMLCEAALEAGWRDRVTACHARAVSMYPEPTFRRLARLARRAGMAFVTDPHTGPLHLRALDLIREGIPVALGQDDIADAYYPYGEHNLLEVAFLASHILHAVTSQDMETLLDMVTGHAARAVRVEDHGLEPGKAADLVVLQGRDAREVLSRHRPPRYVIRGGRVIVENAEETRFFGVDGIAEVDVDPQDED